MRVPATHILHLSAIRIYFNVLFNALRASFMHFHYIIIFCLITSHVQMSAGSSSWGSGEGEVIRRSATNIIIALNYNSRGLGRVTNYLNAIIAINVYIF